MPGSLGWMLYPVKGGGLEMVSGGLLTASLLYPTGGTEAIRNALHILQHQPLPKRNLPANAGGRFYQCADDGFAIR